MEYRENNGRGPLVKAGEKYAGGRGSRVRLVNPDFLGTARFDEDGLWIDPRFGGQPIALKTPGEMDAQGESAKLWFVRLDSNWNPINTYDDLSRDDWSELLDEIDSYRTESFRVLTDFANRLELRALSALPGDEKLSNHSSDVIHSYVFNGIGRDQVESILQREPETEPCAV